mgnify:CR=1 FL=1
MEGSGRHGTFVAAIGDIPVAAENARKKDRPVLLPQEALDDVPASSPTFDWMPGQTMVRSLPSTAWRNACRRIGRNVPPADHGDPQGDPGLRKAISRWLANNRCLQATPEQILITRGSGDFLRLVAQVLVQPADICAVEDPGHALVCDVFSEAGARLQHVPVDADGMEVAQAFGTHIMPALVHITPSHQYPMGARLSLKRRRELADLAQRNGTLILENEYGCEFVYEGRDFPPLYSMAPANTILIGTFANTTTPALRLGFAVAPLGAVTRLVRMVDRYHAQPSWAAQKIIEELILSGDLDRHVRRSQRHYDALRKIVRERLEPYQNLISVLGDIGGLHVVLRGKDSVTDAALQRALTHHAVKFLPIAKLQNQTAGNEGLVFGYGHMDLPLLHASLDLIERCLEALLSIGSIGNA